MITKIMKKEYDQIQERRKHSPLTFGKEGFIVFKGFDGKYYKCDKSGMAGTKEMVDHNKELKRQAEAQTNLI